MCYKLKLRVIKTQIEHDYRNHYTTLRYSTMKVASNHNYLPNVSVFKGICFYHLANVLKCQSVCKLNLTQKITVNTATATTARTITKTATTTFGKFQSQSLKFNEPMPKPMFKEKSAKKDTCLKNFRPKSTPIWAEPSTYYVPPTGGPVDKIK